ncbi:hypothetical protein [Microbacterium sp. cf046]|uniref:hypothetical protein n=1 Tax=Microbacterium sp. cf046 TaxID=1761803 RepID=UPI001C312711|nr:hypothetical protein [Microbacterium sp. cf046]
MPIDSEQSEVELAAVQHVRRACPSLAMNVGASWLPTVLECSEMYLEALESESALFDSCIYRQNPRNYAGFREFDRIAEHVKTPNFRWDAGKLRAKNPRDSGATSGILEARFCPHP